MGAESNSFAWTDLCPKFKPQVKNLNESDEKTNQHDRNDSHKIMKLAEEEWDQIDTRLAKYDQTMNERRAEKVSQTLFDGAIYCPIGSDIVR
jgi:hypothetical protein